VVAAVVLLATSLLPLLMPLPLLPLLLLLLPPLLPSCVD